MPILESIASGSSKGFSSSGGAAVYLGQLYQTYTASSIGTSIVSFTVPSNGIMLIDCLGAKGGTGSNDNGAVESGGFGGRITAYVTLPAGTVCYALCGYIGNTGSGRGGGGGGGFSAVWYGNSNPGAGTWLVGAGGGGGGGAITSAGYNLNDSRGGVTTYTQNNSSPYGGSGGSGGNGGGAGSSGTSSGGGNGGSGGCDCSGGGGGGGYGQSAGAGNNQGAYGGYGGGGGAGDGGSGGWPQRVTSGGGGGGGYVGGAGGTCGGYNGFGGYNFYRSMIVPGIATQVTNNSAGYNSGIGSITIYN